MQRYLSGFTPIASSETSFNITLSTASSASALESTARFWKHGPTAQSVRVSESSGVNFYIAFGSSQVVCGSTVSMFLIGKVPMDIQVPRHFSTSTGLWAAFMTTSTGISTVNITLGYGI